MALTTVSRAGLVAVCSGAVLVLGGVSVVVWRPSGRAAGAVGLVVVGAAIVLPWTLVVLLAQSGALGGVLTALIALMHGLVERRRAGSLVFADPGGSPGPLVPGSSLNRSAGAGTDEPTAIRPRPTSAGDPAFNLPLVVMSPTPKPASGLVSERLEH